MTSSPTALIDCVVYRLPPMGLAVLLLGALGSASLHAQPTLRLEAPFIASGNAFERITAVRELQSGALLVVDHGSNALWHLRAMREQPQRIGRIGRGPAEYRTVGDLWPLAGDTSLLTDQYTGRWLLLVGERIVRTISETRPGNLAVRGTTEGVESAGFVVALRGYRFRPGAPRLEALADSNVVVRASVHDARIDTIAVLAGLGADGLVSIPSRGERPSLFMPFNPLAAAEQVLMQPDGWLAVVRLAPYRVHWRRPDGSWRVGPPLAEPRRLVTKEEQCEAIARLVEASWMRCDPSEWKGWPSEVPPVLWQTRIREPTLTTLPQGRIAIARIPALGDMRRPYDIVDRRGLRVGTLTLALGEVLVGSSPRYAYVAYTDDDGLQALRRYEWPPTVRAPAR